MRRRTKDADPRGVEAPAEPVEPAAATELSPWIRELLLKFTEKDAESTFDRDAFSREPIPAR
jgi:hypothetical protein